MNRRVPLIIRSTGELASAWPRLLCLSVLLLLLLAVAWLAIAPLVSSQGKAAAYFFLGICGAIFANSTGAGGGVVFIPVFNQLGFGEAQAIATSFGIQCFGMSAGALSWHRYYRLQQPRAAAWQDFPRIVLIGSCCSVLGLWSVYGAAAAAPSALQTMFSVFSLGLGVAVICTALLLGSSSRRALEPIDALALAAIAAIGGAVTAWLSVGVGEFIAFYLILRRYDVTLAVASAVAVSALTVWSATPQHFLLAPETSWEVVLCAGPGAVIGGLLARYLVGLLSARRLKLFFGAWLLVIGIAELPALL